MDVKLRHVGSSDVLTVPSTVKERHRVYKVYQGRHGAIVYVPKRKNPFLDKDFVQSHVDNGDRTGFVNGSVNDDELEK